MNSKLTKEEHSEWFQQIWTRNGASLKQHPAPFPVELAYRLIRMFSFYGDRVVDPFAGIGSTLIAAHKANRNAIGIEIEESYIELARTRFIAEGLLVPSPLLNNKSRNAQSIPLKELIS